MSAAITAAIASTTAEIRDTLNDNVGVILVLFGSLVALGILIRMVKRYVGRKA